MATEKKKKNVQGPRDKKGIRRFVGKLGSDKIGKSSGEVETRPRTKRAWGQENIKQRKRFSRRLEFQRRSPVKALQGLRRSRSQDNLLSLFDAAGYEFEEDSHSVDTTTRREKKRQISPNGKKTFGIRPSVTRELNQRKRHTPVSEYPEDTGEECPHEDEEDDPAYRE